MTHHATTLPVSWAGKISSSATRTRQHETALSRPVTLIGATIPHVVSLGIALRYLGKRRIGKPPLLRVVT